MLNTQELHNKLSDAMLALHDFIDEVHSLFGKTLELASQMQNVPVSQGAPEEGSQTENPIPPAPVIPPADTVPDTGSSTDSENVPATETEEGPQTGSENAIDTETDNSHA